MVPQARKFVNYNSLSIQNIAGNFAIGVTSFNITPVANTTIGDLIKQMGVTYEQYRIRRVRVRAQIGKGYTNDLRLKTILASRIDVENQDTAQTGQNFKALVNSENSVIKTFTERGNILVADYRPIMFDNRFTSNDSIPVLPSNSQWYRIEGQQNHQWRGAVLAAAIPDTSISPGEVDITLWQEIDIEFRGRHQVSQTFSTAGLYDRIASEPQQI
jgi:hypothetical protein